MGRQYTPLSYSFFLGGVSGVGPGAMGLVLGDDVGWGVGVVWVGGEMIDSFRDFLFFFGYLYGFCSHVLLHGPVGVVLGDDEV